MVVEGLTADDVNAALRFPPNMWALDFRPHHVIAAGVGDPRLLASQSGHGPAFTLIANGRVAALWGVVIAWPGLAEGWLVGNPDALRPVALAFTRRARQFCDLVHDTLGVRRLQVHVQVANVSFMMWARAARFVEEARLECYLPDGGAVMLMAKTWR